MLADLFESFTGLTWKLRFDWDLGQRCLSIILASWIVRALVGCCLTPFLIEFVTTLALAAAVAKSSMQLKAQGKSVFITGCDTGFGLTLAHHLHELGLTVFAGCLSPSDGGGKQLSSLKSSRMHVVQLDVTKDEDWVACREYVSKHTDSLWGLVNNAGLGTYGEVEWVPMRTYQKLMDVNMFGVIRGCKTFLPMIRKAKGRVVTAASMYGRMAVPTRSPYAMTKYALEGFHDCLRYEMEGFGVKVCLLEPSNFIAGTNIFNSTIVQQQADTMWKEMDEEVRAVYGKDYFDQRVDIMRGYTSGGISDISPVTNAYTNALLDALPQKRYQPMDLYYKVRCTVATHLPEIVYDTIYISHVKRNASGGGSDKGKKN